MISMQQMDCTVIPGFQHWILLQILCLLTATIMEGFSSQRAVLTSK